MPGNRRNPWLRLVHLVVTASTILTLCTPLVRPPHSLAAAHKQRQGSSVADVPLTGSAPSGDAPLPTLGAQERPGSQAPEAAASSVPAGEPQLPPLAASIEVMVDPAEAQAGDVVTLTVRIKAKGDLPEAMLAATLSPGLSPEAGQSEVRFEPEEGAVEWPLGKVSAGEHAWQLQLRVGEEAPDLSVQRIELRVPGFEDAAPREVVIKRRFPPTQRRITPQEGGELQSADGRVHVIFPPGAVSQPVQVEHRPRQVDRMADRQGPMAIEFEVDAFTADASRAPVHQFQEPLELRVNMAGLIDWGALAYYEYPYLGYLSEEGKWVQLPAHREGDVLVAQVDHFSTLGGGTGKVYNSGWLLGFNDATVSTFSGGLTYDYPIEIPEGRGGLTPDLRLSYNSRRVDGLLTWIQTDWVGLGWTLDTMEIVRKVTPIWDASSGSPAWCWEWWDYENTFTLLYNGTGYKLKPHGSNAYGRYSTEDEQFLYIERRNALAGNGSPVNATSEYWVVRLRDGTEYQLGYNPDSEQTIHTNYWTSETAKYAGDHSPDVTFRWRVDQVRDPRGNIIDFYYDETPEDTNSCGGYRERSSYLSEIRYNYIVITSDRFLYTSVPGTRIRFLRAARSSDGVGDSISTTDCWFCRPFYQDDFLQKIRVEAWDNGQYNAVREYLLTYDKRSIPVGEHDNHTRRLRTITEYGRGGYGVGPWLPATTFSYTTYWNKGICQPSWGGSCTDGVNDSWDQECFRYERLIRIDNGYGAEINASYATPDEYCCGRAWNYRVTSKTVSALLGGSTVVYDYDDTVGNRCYDDNNDGVCTNGVIADGKTAGSLVGYKLVTETLKTAKLAGTLGMTAHRYHLNFSTADSGRYTGRELARCGKDWAGNGLSYSQTYWTVVPTTLASGKKTYFVYASLVKDYDIQAGPFPGTLLKETKYYYDPAQQGGTQYGNLTKVEEYTDGALYRETRKYYYPNAASGTYIVDRLAQTALYDSAGQLQARTTTYYDDATYYATPPVRGNPTMVNQLVSVTDTWQIERTSMTTVYTDSLGFYMPIEVADGNGNVTRTAYDTSWRYPTTVTAAYGAPNQQATTYEYDFVLGKVTKETGPNGPTTATSYEYDAFGRLTEVIRPGDDADRPTVRYEYDDFYRPLRIVTSEQITPGVTNHQMTARFYNGLGQLIQESLVARTATQMLVTHYIYNAQGLRAEVYVPYTETTSLGNLAAYVPVEPDRDKTRYAYDVLGRVTTVTNPDGTRVRTAYQGLKRAVLDENDHQHTYESDAFGRLTAVNEFTGAFASVNWGAGPYATTLYQYNELDLLTGVTDQAGNQTTIGYDPMGRKTSIHDPDMGGWCYNYDNAGNLTSQNHLLEAQLPPLAATTDGATSEAATQSTPALQNTCFCYDELNRITRKDYVNSGEPCPAAGSPDPEVSYAYDQGTLGIGYRTGMSDASGSTAWQYDARGRVVVETKTVAGQGGGTFTSRWTYNSRDQVVTQVYPGGNAGESGETVTTGYDTWGLPATLAGTSTYVSGVDLTSDLRPDLLKLGGSAASPVLQVDYVYYPWESTNGRGRLQEIKSGAPASPSLQDLLYTYDAVGNVIGVEERNLLVVTPTVTMDPEAFPIPGLPQETFAYDELDRLIGASKADVRGLGGYSQSFAYDEIGNLTSKTIDGRSSTYSYETAHAAGSVQGTSTVYKDLTVRAMGTYADGGWPQLHVRVNGTDYTARTVTSDTYRDYWWTVALTGNDVIEVLYTNDSGARAVSVDWVSISDVRPGAFTYRLGLPGLSRTGDPTGNLVEAMAIIEPQSGVYDHGTGAGASDWLDVTLGQEQLDENGALRFAVGPEAFDAGYDANGNMVGRLVDGRSELLGWDAENRLVSVTQQDTVSTFVYDGDGNRVKTVVTGSGGTSTVAHIAGYFEWRDGTSQRKYYYHGGQRVAMREGGATTWLLGDHLGSTSVTYRASDGQVVSQHYYAWGTIRPGPDNALPTDFTFTGQRLDELSGLMYYGARWYDPHVGRFVSADSVVPEPGDPQSLNRYSYVRNNPLCFTDPTGLFAEEDLVSQFGQEQVNLWKQDEAWWSLLLAADFGDQVWAHFGAFVIEFANDAGRIGAMLCDRMGRLQTTPVNLTEWEGAPFHEGTWKLIEGAQHAGSLRLAYALRHVRHADLTKATKEGEAKLEYTWLRKTTTLEWAEGGGMRRLQVWGRYSELGASNFTWGKFTGNDPYPIWLPPLAGAGAGILVAPELGAALTVAGWVVWGFDLFTGVRMQAWKASYAVPIHHYPQGH